MTNLFPKARTRLGTATAALLAVGGLAGCGGSTTAASGTAKSYVSNGTLTYVIPASPGKLDPQQSLQVYELAIAPFAYDPLIHISPQGKIVSGLATTWQQSGRTYTFTLRKNVTCSNGTPLTPADVAANLNYAANASNKSPLADLAIPVGSTATANGSAGSVTLTTPTPSAFVLYNLSLLLMVCPNGMANRSILTSHTSGTGPYVLTNANPGVSYTYTRRTGYSWGAGGATNSALGQPKTIVFKVIANQTTTANLLLQGQVNIATVASVDRTRLAAAHLFNRVSRTLLGEIWFNQAPGHPGASVAVRRALTMALDTPSVGNVLAEGHGSPAIDLESTAPAACPGVTTGSLPGFNLAAAKSLLSKAGWIAGPDGIRVKDGKPLSVRVIYLTDYTGDFTDATQLAAQEWKALGVKVTLVGQTTPTLTSTLLTTGNWDVSWNIVGGGNPALFVPYIEGPASPAGLNFAHINDPTYNTLANEATSKPGLTGCSLWNRAEESLFTQADVVPFVDDTIPTWGSGAIFTVSPGGIIPTSIRMVRS